MLFVVLGALSALLVLRQRARAALEIVSVPAGARVRVDEAPQHGVTPLRITACGAARLRLRVELRGYLPWEATFTPATGAVRHIAAAAARVRCTASAWSRTVPTAADRRAIGASLRWGVTCSARGLPAHGRCAS